MTTIYKSIFKSVDFYYLIFRFCDIKTLQNSYLLCKKIKKAIDKDLLWKKLIIDDGYDANKLIVNLSEESYKDTYLTVKAINKTINNSDKIFGKYVDDIPQLVVNFMNNFNPVSYDNFINRLCNFIFNDSNDLKVYYGLDEDFYKTIKNMLVYCHNNKSGFKTIEYLLRKIVNFDFVMKINDSVCVKVISPPKDNTIKAHIILKDKIDPNKKMVNIYEFIDEYKNEIFSYIINESIRLNKNKNKN